ncbi:adrenodoxin-like protein 1, mitochondrial [Lotus japonicus]|uniref:adrenodoxin-like protein 1, mitochondrial n=1 Tax=Lotus japonicus TaxID=34305 RepID=UPI00258A5607|nr:adrenodoxin-like protein 1, mitochondrial [Lotus japonicus]
MLAGACEGSLACSTCHVIVMDVEQYNKLEDPTDEENDMLDLAFGPFETSCLGCQVIAGPEPDGIRLAIPAATQLAILILIPLPHRHHDLTPVFNFQLFNLHLCRKVKFAMDQCGQ